jgi:hypothetical protein
MRACQILPPATMRQTRGLSRSPCDSHWLRNPQPPPGQPPPPLRSAVHTTRRGRLLAGRSIAAPAAGAPHPSEWTRYPIKPLDCRSRLLIHMISNVAVFQCSMYRVFQIGCDRIRIFHSISPSVPFRSTPTITGAITSRSTITSMTCARACSSRISVRWKRGNVITSTTANQWVPTGDRQAQRGRNFGHRSHTPAPARPKRAYLRPCRRA